MKKIFLVFFFFIFFLTNYNFAVASNVCDSCVIIGSVDPCAPLVCSDGQCKESDKTTFCSFSHNNDIKILINEVAKWMMIVALVLAPLMILLGGFFMLTASGDTKRSTKGKQIILWAIIGLAIILFAKAFVSILKSVL